MYTVSKYISVAAPKQGYLYKDRKSCCPKKPQKISMTVRNTPQKSTLVGCTDALRSFRFFLEYGSGERELSPKFSQNLTLLQLTVVLVGKLWLFIVFILRKETQGRIPRG